MTNSTQPAACTCDPDILVIYGCSCQPGGIFDAPVATVTAPESVNRWWNLPIAARMWREDGRDRHA